MTANDPFALDRLRRMATDVKTPEAEFDWEFLEYTLLRLNDPILWDIWWLRHIPIDESDEVPPHSL